MKLQENIIQYIRDNRTKLLEGLPDFVQEVRKTAQERFIVKGFPTVKDEKWRKTSLKFFENRYFHPSMGSIIDKNRLETDVCLVPELDTKNISIINGKFFAGSEWEEMDNGVMIGSLQMAWQKQPELVQKHFHRLAAKEDLSFVDLNTAMFTGGLFLYVPEGVKDFRLQITHKLDAKIDALLNVRNLIIVEEGSSVDIIQCDDSNVHRSHLATFVSEVVLGEKASLNWYKYQNINNISALISDAFFEVASDAKVYTNYFELNGKLLRNEQYAYITGDNATVDFNGLYLTDKTQQADNLIYVAHDAEDSYSNQKFKGIVDDSGRAFFNGHILVKPGAQQTQAYQKNDNILLTDKARISSQPFLEIYADDVSCSHGSTTGQIDEEALFYIRQRGIDKRDAQLLQLYAFAGEIIDRIHIPELLEPIKDLVKKRLNGELDACEDCILQCTTKTV